MDSKRIIGIVLIVIGVTVAVHTIVEPLYHVSSEAHPYSPLWNLLDPLMGAGARAGADSRLSAYATRQQRRARRARDLERLVATTMFYGFLGVGILFFWSWFNTMSVSADFAPGKSENVSAVVWIIIDTLLPLFLGANRRIPSPATTRKGERE